MSSERRIPVSKVCKRLLFSRDGLVLHLKKGIKKTQADIAREVDEMIARALTQKKKRK
jgi:hypothetical protein